MENSGVSKHTISFGLALAMACVVNALLVVAKEKIPAVMSGLQHLTGHHWVSQVFIVVGVFPIFGWLCARGNGGKGMAMSALRLIGLVVPGVAVGGLIIAGFYLIAG